jgi:uncharacterized protein (DUF924 family)
VTGIVTFWREAGPDKWFEKDERFDITCRRFLDQHLAVAARQHDDWMVTAKGALALILLTDQIPRNIFCGTAHMFATDPLARSFARQAIDAALMDQIEPCLSGFFTLPFEHSEDPADQDLSVALATGLGGSWLEYAEHHRDIIRRFGRFPHRNALLGRRNTAEEADFLASGGFSG